MNGRRKEVPSIHIGSNRVGPAVERGLAEPVLESIVIFIYWRQSSRMGLRSRLKETGGIGRGDISRISRTAGCEMSVVHWKCRLYRSRCVSNSHCLTRKPRRQSGSRTAILSDNTGRPQRRQLQRIDPSDPQATATVRLPHEPTRCGVHRQPSDEQARNVPDSLFENRSRGEHASRRFAPVGAGSCRVHRSVRQMLRS